MYVVGVGLVKVYKALIRLVRGALSAPLLMSMSEAFLVPFSYSNKTAKQKLLSDQAWSLVPKLNLASLAITNLMPFTISYHKNLQYCLA